MAERNRAVIEIGADVAQAQAAIASLEDKIGGLGQLLAGGFGIAAFTSIVQGAIDAADSLNDLAQKTGISVETLSGLRLAADQSGITLDNIASSVRKLSVYMVENAESVRAAGVTATTADDALIQLADIFKAMPDGIQKTALATEFFGKAGADMIPMLNQGSEALREQIATGQQYNTITTEMAANADLFGDALSVLKSQASGAATALASELLKTLAPIAEELSRVDSAGSSAAQTIGGALAESVRALVVLGSEVAFTFRAVGTEIGGITAQIAALARGDFDAAGAIREAMIADAEKARADHDAFIDRIISAGQQAKSEAQEGAKAIQGARLQNTEAELIASITANALTGIKAQQSEAQKAAEAQAKAHDDAIRRIDEIIAKNRQQYAETMSGIVAQAAGIGKSEAEQARLNARRQIELDLARDLLEIDKQRGIAPAEREQRKATVSQEAEQALATIPDAAADVAAASAREAALKRIGEQLADNQRQYAETIDAIQFEQSLIGKTTAEVEALNAERRIALELAKQLDAINRSALPEADKQAAREQATSQAETAKAEILPALSGLSAAEQAERDQAERATRLANLAQRASDINAALLSEQEQARIAHDQRMATITAWHEEQIAAFASQGATVEEVEAAHQARMAAIAQEAQTVDDASIAAATDAERLRYEQELIAAQEQAAAREAIDEQYRQTKERLELEHQARLGNIEAHGALARLKFDSMTAAQQTKSVLGQMVALTAGAARHNRAAFEANKIAGIANATISAYEGASKSMAAYPQPLASVMAGLHLVAGMALVKNIQSQSFGAGASGSGVVQSVSAPPDSGTTASPPPPPVSSDALRRLEERPPTIINMEFATQFGDVKAVAKQLIPVINEAARLGYPVELRTS